MLDIAQVTPERARALRRSEYERLVEEGCFSNERIELLEGVLVEMSPQGPAHADVVSRLTMILARAIGDRAVLRAQSPLAVSDDSEPEPDLALVPPGDYRRAHPEHAWLAIEVAGASLKKDLGVKAALYARSKVDEYWVVNLEAGTVLVHAESDGQRYGRISTARQGDVLRLGALPDLALRVADFLPTS